MGSGFLKKKKQAKAFQEQLMGMQEQLTKQMEEVEVTGTSGNGLVKITINGGHDVKKVSINPECVDPEDIEGLETLIKAAFHDADKQLKEMTESGGLPGMENLQMPGLGF